MNKPYEALAEHAPFCIFHTDAAGSATYTNEAWLALSGLSYEESLGTGWLSVVHPKDKQQVSTGWTTAVAAGEDYACSFRIRAADGTRRYCYATARRIPVGSTAAGSYVGALIDITDRVQAERDLRKANKLLEAVLESIPCGVNVYDARGRLLLDNLVSRHVSGLRTLVRAEATTDFGTLLVNTTGLADLALADETDEPLYHSPLERTTHLRQELQPDGRILEVRHVSMSGGGTVTTYSDVTQHKRIINDLTEANAAAQQGASAKSAFLATMSHEIRTPMNGVIGMTNLLLNTPLSDDQRELVDMIKQSGESLLVVINDILDYSRIDSGRMELEWLPVRLRDVLDTSIQIVAIKAREKCVEISVQVADNVPAIIFGDKTRLQQIFVNLLSNAVKFAPSGSVRIAVSNEGGGSSPQTKQASGHMSVVSVAVEDTGVGIPPDKINTLFEPFVQADASTGRRFGGSGLGLAIVKRLVHAMGGDISLQSQVGTGTTVTFTLLAESVLPEPTDTSSPLVGKNVLVLVPTSIRAALAIQLKRWGVNCVACGDVSLLWSLLATSKSPDLVIADESLLRRGQRDGASELEERYFGPVLLLSSDLTPQHASCWRPKLKPCLPWPIDEAGLYEHLLGALKDACATSSGARIIRDCFDLSLAERAPLRILVADDNPINCAVTTRTLAGFGYEADVVTDGAGAIKAARRTSYDLILMDMQMPEIDGLVATKAILGAADSLNGPRIVILSASAMPDEVSAAYAAGADGYLAKPLSLGALRKVLERYSTDDPSVLHKSDALNKWPLFSAEKLSEYLKGDDGPEFVKGLARSFSEAATVSLAKLRAAASSGANAAVRSLAHELAGMCAVIGAPRMMQCNQLLSRIASEGSLVDAGELILRCQSDLEQTIDEISRFIRNCARASQHIGTASSHTYRALDVEV